MSNVIIPANLWEEDLEGAVSIWFFEEGDNVSEGDTLCEIMVEKSTFEVEAPAAGVLRILVQVEVPVKKGDAIAHIG